MRAATAGPGPGRVRGPGTGLVRLRVVVIVTVLVAGGVVNITSIAAPIAVVPRVGIADIVVIAARLVAGVLQGREVLLEIGVPRVGVPRDVGASHIASVTASVAAGVTAGAEVLLYPQRG